MLTVHLLLVVLALVCLFLAGFGFPSGRLRLEWLGIALWLTAVSIR